MARRTVKDPVTPLVYIGNKTDMLDMIAQSFPSGDVMDRTWVVPFCGSLAAPLHFKPSRLVISDFNPHLINFWRGVKADARQVMHYAEKWSPEPGSRPAIMEAAYYAARDELNRKTKLCQFDLLMAGLFLVVNRFGWRGIFRVNAGGLCNTPFDQARKGSSALPATELVVGCGDYLRKAEAEIYCEGWSTTAKRALDMRGSAFVVADPPYHRKTYDYSSCVAGGSPFGSHGQLRLASRLHNLRQHGIPFMMHNNPTDMIAWLYRERWCTWRWIDCDHKIGYGKRLDSAVKEVIITGCAE